MPWNGGGNIEITDHADWTSKTASIYQNLLFNQSGERCPGVDMYLPLIDFYHHSCLQSAPKESIGKVNASITY